MKKIILKELEWIVWTLAFALTATSVVMAKFDMEKLGFGVFVSAIIGYLISIGIFVSKRKQR